MIAKQDLKRQDVKKSTFRQELKGKKIVYLGQTSTKQKDYRNKTGKGKRAKNNNESEMACEEDILYLHCLKIL